MSDNNSGTQTIHITTANPVVTVTNNGKQSQIVKRITNNQIIHEGVVEEEHYEILENNNQVNNQQQQQQQQHVFLEPATTTIVTSTHNEPDYEDLLDDIPLNPSQQVQYDDDELNDEDLDDDESNDAMQHPSSVAGGGASQNTGNFIARLMSKDNILLVSDHTIEIGRNSSKSSVHFHVGKNSFVSRKHIVLQYDPKCKGFYMLCLSKNGVFVDGVFTRKGAEPLRLPNKCSLRFPSTNIRINFENLANQPFEVSHNTGHNKNSINSVENSNTFYSPLKISIPDGDKLKSPFPSPTGTISAANSCPTSPRQGYHEFPYHGHNPNHSYQSESQVPSTSSNNEHEKPPYSYAQLIVQSISASPDKQLTLSGIYSFISKNYPYYRTGANKGWQNSIRHNLSLNRYFIKVPRSQDEPGKGSFWRIDPLSEMKLIDQSYRKRRQRGSQCFRTPYGMPRSAPVSPSQIDNSREGSPLNDVIMQSAPGSPGSNNYNSNHRDDHNFGNPSSYKSVHHYDQSGLKNESNDIYEDQEQIEYLSDEYEPSIKRQKI